MIDWERAKEYVHALVENSKQDIKSELRPLLEREDVQDLLTAVFLDGWHEGEIREARKHVEFVAVTK